MHLKTLTVRGFKSFASATTFDFEPGVTAVVGPNGSGKSNVVDALAWVMGEQGAKSLRGGKMEDVIFAGTSGRSALGRAHVSLTIDNADGALPIEYSEVTIARTLFRSGGSEYAINGRSCRLLDIQELLSDSGLGREMHVIVGQGQLDRILQATPEDRRGFIEEASGILKHRRRKEKTLRKLDSLQANLDRLEDLVGEIQRQLTPLGRQARTARKAQRIQYDARDARARLLADDVVQARAALETDARESERTRAEKARLEQAFEEISATLRETEAQAARTAPVLNAARTSWYELSTARDRFRALGSLAAERRRLLGSPEPERASEQDVSRLEDQAARSREEAARVEAETRTARDRLTAAQQAREGAETQARSAQEDASALVRQAADRRAGQAKLAAAVTSARSALSSAESDLDRLRAEISDVSSRVGAAREEHSGLAARAEEAAEVARRSALSADEAQQRADATQAAARDAEAERQRVVRERQAVQVRLETLRQSVPAPDGSGTVTASHAHTLLGAVTDAVRVRRGWERAVAAALGPWAEALAVRSQSSAAEIFAALRDAGSGRVNLLVAADTRGADTATPELPHDAVWAGEVLEATSEEGASHVVDVVRQFLARTVLVPDAAAAMTVLGKDPALHVVTAGGDVHGGHIARGGSAEATAGLEVHARIERARDDLDRWDAQVEGAGRTAERTEQERARAAEASRDAARTAREHQKLSAEAANALSRAEALQSSAGAELQRREEALATAQERLAERETALAEALSRAEAAEHGDDEDLERRQIEAAGARDRAEAAARQAREEETQARLALRGLEEQHRHALSRAESQQRAAKAEKLARAEAARRAERRRVQAAVAQAVVTACEYLRVRAEESVNRAAAERDAVEVRRAGLDEAAGRLRSRRDEAGQELNRVTERLHREELDLTQRRSRLEAVETTSLEELGMTPDFLVDNFGPHLPVPDPDALTDEDVARQPVGDAEAGSATPAGNDTEDGEQAQPDAPAPQPAAATASARAPSMSDPGTPFVRAEQETRWRRAQKQLEALGKVNPLALEEFAALEERHTFLAEQLEDVKRSRADLHAIIRQVDEHVERVFTQAYHDTAEQFVEVFATLFPGGEGRLRLTDPDDMLTSGVEVEARPAGKKIKRLSLLSGGERSLTALALLVAIFKARPSPFYVMDEVEAALDDRNLGRLLSIFTQLQESSQLIIVTHQKRTMEIADALYGVSMRGDGVSLVVGQKLSELQ